MLERCEGAAYAINHSVALHSCRMLFIFLDQLPASQPAYPKQIQILSKPSELPLTTLNTLTTRPKLTLEQPETESKPPKGT